MTWAERYPSARLVAPDQTWPRRFVEVDAELRAALGHAWQVEHVGSTSVPGLLAKPVIDVALRVPAGAAPEESSVPWARAGWTVPVVVGDHWATFQTYDGVRTAIGHVFTARQWPEAHVRLFAHWLRSHPEDRDRYAALKQGLVSRDVWGSDYTAAKGEFVLVIVNRARAERGLPAIKAPL
jgi:GrpB-like predicted nucleotidyltransferase (UPF0157 family)